MPYIASRLSSLVIDVPLASAASLSQFDRQLRQKPARFIRSMFCTSLRERRCSTRRRNTAASSSVLVLSSVVMPMALSRTQEVDIKWDLSQILPYRSAKTAPRLQQLRSAAALDRARGLAKSPKN